MDVCNDLTRKFSPPLVAGLALVSLLFMPLAAGNLWWREAFNSGHTILFIFIAFGLYFWLETAFRFSSTAVTYLLVLVTGMLFGIAIELLQGLMQREASVDDLYRNLFGIISGLGLVALVRQELPRNKILMFLFSLGFLLLGTASLLQISWHYIQRGSAFPQITEFDEKWISSFIRFNNTALLGPAVSAGDEGVKLYRLRFDRGKYPGISIIEPEENWLAYSKLRLSVFSHNKAELKLVLRVHDERHNQNYNDRFNQAYTIHPGLNELTVSLNEIRNAPLGRELDLANIAGIKLFLIDTEYSLFLEVSNMFLEQ